MKCKDCKKHSVINTDYGTVRKCAVDGTLLSDQDAEKRCVQKER